MNRPPLAELKILDLSRVLAGPYCTMMLADAGAEVIKIESPSTGDASREPGPILKNEKGEKISGYFMRFNRNKKSLTLNLKDEKGKKIFEQMMEKSDVLLENMKPGFLKSMGYDYKKIQEINPKLVYAAISGFGTSEKYKGPFSDRTAYDIVIQAMGGLMNLIGDENGPPLHPMIAFGDVVPGMMTAYAIMLGLYKREKTGKGEYIDMAMFDVMMALTERALNVYSMTGSVMSRGKENLIYPWGSFKTKDGYIALIVQELKMWKRFCQAIGKPELIEDERFVTAGLRAKHKKELDPIINGWLQDKTTEEVTNILIEAGVPVGPVRNAEEIYNCEHAKARKMWVEFDDPVASKIKLVGNPVKMDSVPAPDTAKTVPRLGENTEELLKNLLNYSEEEIKELKDSNIV
jgi:crotonobetainyl-CoA:carnitine CoA-transferase CaiB-like acyl-CoA transferase